VDPIEEQLYAIAGQEVASRNMSPGLMAKALSDAEGDERKAAATYIKLRVEQLRAEQAARAAAEVLLAKRRRVLMEEDKRLKETARQTRCPKCGYLGKMKLSFWCFITEEDCKCPKCNHRFRWYYVP